MKLAKTNNLPLDKFINLALYGEDKGYYMKKIQLQQQILNLKSIGFKIMTMLKTFIQWT